MRPESLKIRDTFVAAFKLPPDKTHPTVLFVVDEPDPSVNR